jgi:hypothetical protein
MATGKPRITITLEKEQYEVINRLATLQRGSMSRIITELLAEVTPMLQQVCNTMEIAVKANADMKARIFKSCEEAEADMRPLVEAFNSQFDLFAAGIERAADAGAASGDTAPLSGDADPRPVITGVTKPKKGTKSPKSDAPKG